MSDSKLRELERRWRETKSVEDEAAYLRERVRVGDLPVRHLQLGVFFGHEPAKLALGSNGPAGWNTLDEAMLVDRIRGEIGFPAAVLAVAGAIRAGVTQGVPEVAVEALRTLENWGRGDEGQEADPAAIPMPELFRLRRSLEGTPQILTSAVSDLAAGARSAQPPPLAIGSLILALDKAVEVCGRGVAYEGLRTNILRLLALSADPSPRNPDELASRL